MKKYHKLIGLILPLILIACGNGNPEENQGGPTIMEQGRLYDEERYACREYTVFWQDLNYSALGGEAAIRHAIQTWNIALGATRLKPLDSPDKASNPFRDENKARSAIFIWIENDQEPQGFARPWKQYGPCACGISMRPEAANSILLLAHELGHCLGLYHTTEEGSIMEKYVDTDAYITQENIDLVLEHTNLDDPPQDI